jgi:hypothetical protein
MRMTVRQPLASYPDPTRAVSAWQLLQWASTIALPLSSAELFWPQAGSEEHNTAVSKYRIDFFDMVPLDVGSCFFVILRKLLRSTAEIQSSSAWLHAATRKALK